MKRSKPEIARFVEQEFSALACAEKAVAMAAYMKTEMPFYGIQKPERIPIYKQLAKQFKPVTRNEYEENVRALWQLAHREEKYAALEYASSFPDFIASESLALYEDLIREGAWWDFVDTIAINLVGHAYLKERALMKRRIDSMATDNDMWIRRTSLICHNHHKKNTDEKQLFSTCLALADEKEFFIRKAIGWALREYSYPAPEAVQRFVLANKTRLAPLSVREAVKQLVRSGAMKPI